MRGREYAGPLGVLAAGVLGFSLLCSVSALAKSDLYSHSLKALEPVNLVDLAVANLSTSVALTQQAVTAFVSTPTTVPTDIASLTPQQVPSDTARPAASPTPLQLTRTRRSQAANTARPLSAQTRTRIPAATSTLLPTDTPLPPPPTDTPLPPPTATEPPLPPPTDTAAPPPPDTQPPPTDPPIQILDSTPTP